MAEEFKGFKDDAERDRFWLGVASKQLLGKRIVKVRYMSQEEVDELGWNSRPVVIQLDDGNLVWPSRDDEGNDAGSLFTNDDKQPCLPVL